jgi:hypothetical protein
VGFRLQPLEFQTTLLCPKENEAEYEPTPPPTTHIAELQRKGDTLFLHGNPLWEGVQKDDCTLGVRDDSVVQSTKESLDLGTLRRLSSLLKVW